MIVMVVGSGGREHAIASRLARSPDVKRVICVPGNAGTASIADNIGASIDDVPALVAIAHNHKVDLVVVGPEAPLVAGLVDALSDIGVAAFGPRKQAAVLEGSKVHSKLFMARHKVPTAAFEIFDDADKADAYIRDCNRPLVVKADGLAAGKGVIVASGPDEALDAVDRIMRKREFGDAGAQVVIEECLRGQEVSYHVVVAPDGYVPLAAAQDHKRLLDGDRGPNTGGMGAYSPPPIVTPELERKILEQVVAPTLAGFTADGIDYRGALFIGLMIVDGEPSVLEYNVRFGDPETEVLMARWGGDVLPLFLGAARGRLRDVKPTWEAPAAMCVVLAAEGYPGAYEKGREIQGLDAAAARPFVDVFHAGTANRDGRVVSTGGRVLAVTARGASIEAVAKLAYAAVRDIQLEGAQFRTDIGHHARSQ